MSDWDEWVRRTTAGATSRQVAERIGRSHTTALKWMHRPTPEHVIGLAVAYNADLIAALVAAGMLPAEDVKNLNLDATLKSTPTVKLAAELYRRALAHSKSTEQSVFDMPREL
jgi:hypothetical protein